jgi:hypothetical protein
MGHNNKLHLVVSDSCSFDLFKADKNGKIAQLISYLIIEPIYSPCATMQLDHPM